MFINNDSFLSRDAIREDPEVDILAIVDAVLKESRKEEIVYKNQCLKSLSEILSSLEVDRFEDVYEIIQNILGGYATNKAEDDQDVSGEELSKNRENNIKLKESAYETLGKAWPSNSKETQEKYREILIDHIENCLPTVTRSIQVSVVSALYLYVDKLLLLNEDNLTDVEKESLKKIIQGILKVLSYALNISKHTRLRKEALNIVLILATKLKDKNRTREFEDLKLLFNNILVNISNDNQPEIKSRVNDIKKILSSD